MSLKAANYDFSFSPGILKVTPPTLTVTAKPATRSYGAANPSFGYSLSGFVNTENTSVVTGTASCSTTATKTSPIGTYPITCTIGSLTSAVYGFSFSPGTLRVTPATLTVTANAATRVYGATNPSLGYSLSGFVNTENTSVVTGTASCSTTATKTSPIGTYPDHLHDRIADGGELRVLLQGREPVGHPRPALRLARIPHKGPGIGRNQGDHHWQQLHRGALGQVRRNNSHNLHGHRHHKHHGHDQVPPSRRRRHVGNHLRRDGHYGHRVHLPGSPDDHLSHTDGRQAGRRDNGDGHWDRVHFRGHRRLRYRPPWDHSDGRFHSQDHRQGPSHTAGTVTVTVTTGGGTSGAKLYAYDPVPTITSISRTSGPVSGGTTVTVTGTGFTSGATVAFGTGHPGTTVMVVSTAKITVKAPAHAAGTVTVTVTTGGGTSGAKLYAYANAPTIISITPTAGKPSGGTTVTITGTGFTQGPPSPSVQATLGPQ